MQLKILHPDNKKPDIFDRVREKDIFDRVKLDPKDEVLLSPELAKMITERVNAAVREIVASLPKPEAPKEIVREVRVEVPAKDTRDLVERKELEALKKEAEKLRKELEETRRIAEIPTIVPGGPGVIGIPPPEAASVGDVLTVDENKKAKFKPPTGGSGSGLSGYTISGAGIKTLDTSNVSVDELAQLVYQIIDDLQ